MSSRTRTSSKSSKSRIKYVPRSNSDGDFYVNAIGPDGRRYGYIDVEVGVGAVTGVGRLAYVENAVVESKHRQNQIAAGLFNKAAQVACAQGLRLASYATRTKAIEAFWRKRVAQGRATCAVKGGSTAKSKCKIFALKCPVRRK